MLLLLIIVVFPPHFVLRNNRLPRVRDGASLLPLSICLMAFCSRQTLVRILAIALSLSSASPLLSASTPGVRSGSAWSATVPVPRADVSKQPPSRVQHLATATRTTVARHPLSAGTSESSRRKAPGCVRRQASVDSCVGEATTATPREEETQPEEKPHAVAAEAAPPSETRTSPPIGADPTFRDLFSGRLPDWLFARLEQLGFATPTLVQRQALEVILGGENDAVLHAQTGSGKTLAFLLPLFASLDPSRSAVQGLVVVPTRELGLQVAGVAKRLAAGTGAATGGKVQVRSVCRQIDCTLVFWFLHRSH